MSITKYILSFTVAIFFGITACVPQSGTFDEMVDKLIDKSVPIVKVDDVVSMKKANPNLILLDSREKKEFKVSHIEGAQCVGYDNFKLSSVKDLSPNDTIVIYCSVGYRSEKVGEKLKAAGFKNVYNLYGGIFDWVNSDQEVVKDEKEPTKKVHAYNKDWGYWLNKGEKVY